MKFKKRFLVLPVLVVLCGYLLYSVYGEVQEKTISEFNNQQKILAKQAAKGIETYFKHNRRLLTHFSQIEDVVLMNAEGRSFLESFYHNHSDEISAVTRVSEKGRIVYTIPFNEKAIGTDISYQDHVKYIMQNQQPVISDVFKAVQGYYTIAYHVPVFHDGKFKGTLAVLIPFKHLAKEYLENIRIAQSGYAWVLSQKGVELYCPVPGHVGGTIFKSSRAYPSVIAMANEMVKGRQGTTTYTHDRVKGETVEMTTKHAVYFPIHLGNTFWSIVVATPEEEVLATMTGFKNRMLLIVAILMFCGLFFSYYLIRALAILKEEKKRKSVEKALRESEERIKTIFEASPDPVVIYDIEGHPEYLNPAFTNVFGWVIDELRSRKIPFVPDDQMALTTEKIKELYRSGKPIRFECRRFSKSGALIDILISAAVIHQQNGDTVGMVVTLTDITERKRLEAQLQQAQKMEAIGTLTGGIAHDFNNILGIIIGNTELILSEVTKSENIYNYLGEIKKAGLRAKDIVTQLLSFAHKTTLNRKPIRIIPVIEDSIQFLRATLPSSIDIRKDLQLKNDCILADATQIHQVMINLCANAAHAMREGGVLEIVLRNVFLDESSVLFETDQVKGYYIEIRVKDNGEGIAAEYVDRIFDPYFTTKDVGKGTGLGLSVVHGIVQNYNGAIAVESKPDQG